jgi:hypothetical protein
VNVHNNIFEQQYAASVELNFHKKNKFLLYIH